MERFCLDNLQNHLEIVSGKIGEYFQICDNLNREIRQIEDRANEQIDHDKELFQTEIEESMSQIDEYLSSAMNYADTIMTSINTSKMYLENQTKNMELYWQQAEQVGDIRVPEYSSEPADDIKILENLQMDISMKLSRSIGVQNAGFFNLGKKILGYQENSKIVELCTMILKAERFYQGLNEHFKQLYENLRRYKEDEFFAYRDKVFQEADKDVADRDAKANQNIQQWFQELRGILEQHLPLENLQKAEQIYEEINKDSSRGIQLGTLYFYIGGLKQAEDVYSYMLERYGCYIQKDYIVIKAVWKNTKLGNFIFSNYENAEFHGKDEMESILVKELRHFPAGEFEFRVCNSSGVIDQYKELTGFISQFPTISGGKIFTRKNEILEVLRIYEERMDELMQKKLIGYKNIEEFNKKNPSQKISYQCLCITGFPSNFSEEMLELLQRLFKQGMQCGIQVLLGYEESYNDAAQNSSRGSLIRSILNLGCNFVQKENFWRNVRYPEMDLILEKSSFATAEGNLLEEFAKYYSRMSNAVLEFENIIGEEAYYQGYSGDGLCIPIGMNEYGEKQYLEMGDTVANGTSHYAIVIGPTGSGKSTLLHTIIMSSMLTYRPEELELYLMDFKEGTEFKIYEEKRLPNIKCLSLDTMQEFGESILNELWNILQERNERFTEASRLGNEIKNIRDYRRAGYQMSRILVIMDEFQVLFDRDWNRKVADRSAARMSEFISKARAYGIHFIFATQTLHRIMEGGSAISRSTLEEMHIRIGLQCQEKEMEQLFGAKNLKECMNKTTGKKGSAIYLENDIVSAPVGMQVAYINTDEQKAVIQKLEDHYRNETYRETLVFRGKNEPVFHGDVAERSQNDADSIYIGEPIHIGEPVSIKHNKKRRTNVFAVGENIEMLNRISRLWLMQASRKGRVYLFDGNEMIGEEGISSGIVFSEKEQNAIVGVDNIFRVIPVIHDLYHIYEKRKQNMVSGQRLKEDEEKIYVLISNYQWIEPIARIMENKSVVEFEPDAEDTTAGSALESMLAMMNETSKQANQPGSEKQFRILLENGYLCGIHLFMTCNEFSCVKKIMSSDLAPFTNRILLKMNTPVSCTFIDSDINMKYMRENTVLFSDGIQAPYLMKPYRLEGE